MHADQRAAAETPGDWFCYRWDITHSTNSTVTCEVLWRFRPGPIPFVNPDGSLTNVYGPLGWHRLGELPDKERV